MKAGSYALSWPLFGRGCSLRIETGNRGILRISWHFGRSGLPPLPRRLALPFRAYLAGRAAALERLPVDLGALTEFQRRTLHALRKLPPGAYATYAGLAAELGRPRAARAVGQVMRANPIPIVIPCHRVLPADGSLGGYTPGRRYKRGLLAHEGFRLDPVRRPTTIQRRRGTRSSMRPA